MNFKTLILAVTLAAELTSAPTTVPADTHKHDFGPQYPLTEMVNPVSPGHQDTDAAIRTFYLQECRICDLPFAPPLTSTGEASVWDSSQLQQVFPQLSPFHIKVTDRASLENRRINHTRVFIKTELADWSYSVRAEYGTVSEITSNSFLYTSPQDQKQLRDLLTITLKQPANTDGEGTPERILFLPLHFRMTHEAILEEWN